jgi:hypothetical protein
MRPDEFAECVDGVPDNLYRKLWSLVEQYKAPSPEVSEEPCYGMDTLNDFWDEFTSDEQNLLELLYYLHTKER